MTATEFLKDKGIHPTEPIYWELEERIIPLHELLDEYASSKMPSKGKARKQAGKMCINKDQGEGFGMCFGWIISLAKPTKKP